MIMLPLQLVLNWPVFAFNVWCFITILNFKSPSSPMIFFFNFEMGYMCNFVGYVFNFVVCCVVVQNFTLTEIFLSKRYLCNHQKHFYMSPCWIFSFQNCKFLTVERVMGVNGHGAKFRDDRPNDCFLYGDISTFSERSRSRSLYAVAFPSVCRLSSVWNVRMPYSAGWNFRQCSYIIWYPGHPLASTKNFTEIIPQKSLRRGC